ncbi:MAG: isochorismate synthase [Acidobacteria bacterium]|nr:isochorismate synthase [Acidobacteriota bacterium]
MNHPPLLARTRRLDGEIDLVALAGDDGLLLCREGVGLAGIGMSGRIDLERRSGEQDAASLRDQLSAIAVENAVGGPGTGAVALGALPFAPHQPGHLTIPRVVVGRNEDGEQWVTTITGGDERPSDDEIEELIARGRPSTRGFRRDASLTSPDRSPSSYSVRSEVPPSRWCEAVAAATERIRAGELDKVVLARVVEVMADAEILPSAVLAHLRRTHPASVLFSIEGFVGATPEMLVSRHGDIVRAHPMAGTAPRSGDTETDARLAAALLASPNTRAEHRHTIDMVHDTLLPWCSFLDEEDEPSIVAMANVQHLATRLEGRLSEPAASVIELVTALHPTPAVGGTPRDRALELIDGLEPIDRGRYAGPVGWIDTAGNGVWVVGIRSAEISGHTARLSAGVGVVADSDPETELAETRAKLQTMLTAIVRP